MNTSDDRPERDRTPTSEAPLDEPLTALLARRARDGDMERFNQLYERVMPALCGWAMFRIGPNLRARLDPEEIVQETWVRAVRGFEQFDASRPFRAWIFGVAKHVVLEALRDARAGTAAGRALTTNRFALEDQADTVTSVTLRAARKDAMEVFLERVRSLGEDEQTLVRMCGLEGATCKEAALRLGIGEEAAKKRWQRLKSELIARDMPRDLCFDD